jgi:hypothetical protein
MVILSQSPQFSDKMRDRCRDYSLKEVPSVECGWEAPDSVLLKITQ